MFTFKKGQTLIEVITATSIISMSLLVILSLAASSISFGTHSRDEIIAGNLAREGIESAIIIRDRNWLNGLGAFNLLSDGDFIIDPANGILMANETISIANADSGVIDNCNNCAIYLNTLGNGQIYSYFSPVFPQQITPYKRLIKIVTDGAKKKITSQVSWSSKGKMHYFSLDTYLTDWR